MREVLHALNDADLALEVFLLGLDEVAVRGVHFGVDAAHVARQRGLPIIPLAHQGHAILPTEEHPAQRQAVQVSRLDKPDKRQGGVIIEGLARWIILALIVRSGELRYKFSIQAATQEFAK
jgi:hypothetical protein